MPVTIIPAELMRQRAGGISKATELRRIKNDPRWPKPIYLSPQRRGYLEEEADAYLRWHAEHRRELPDQAEAGAEE